MKAVVFTLGCKVNEVESASIMSALENLGLEVSDNLSYADVYVLNTCAVTREAEKKSRQLVARVRKFNPENPRVYKNSGRLQQFLFVQYNTLSPRPRGFASRRRYSERNK